MIARGDLDFLPRVNWRFWAPVLTLVIAFPAIWTYLRHRELEARRGELLREHAALTGDLASRYNVVRDRLEGLVLRSVGPYEGDLREPTFHLEDLASGASLYARTRLGEIHDRNDLAASIRHRYADQVMPCLGLEGAWLRELFDKGAFLRPSYVDTVRGADSPERIAALRTDLRGRLSRDRASLEQALALRYFVLAVDEAALSIEGPTRVYVFDVTTGRPLLRVRGEGNDLVLVPFRIAGVPAPAANAPRGRTPTVSQHDCSVANSVRSALGVSPMGLTHGPAPEPFDPSAADASSATDAASARD